MAIRKESVDVGAVGDFGERMAEFARFLQRENRSPATVSAYRWGLDDLRDYLASRGICALEQITRADLEGWQDRLLAARMRPRSRSLATTAARQFFRWAGDHEYCDLRLKDWLATVRLRPLKPKPIPPEDLARLLEWYEPRPSDLAGLRNRAMFMVYLTTGLRVSEGLLLPRVGWERVEVRQKGGGEKLVTVPDEVQPYVRDYLSRRVDHTPALFVHHPSGARMTPGGVRQVWQTVSHKLGIAPFTTHALRHTFATQLLAKGIDIRVVAEMMGHKGLSSIMGYTQVFERARQDANRAIVQVIHPPEQTLPPDPRELTVQRLSKINGPKRRGRPRFRIAR